MAAGSTTGSLLATVGFGLMVWNVVAVTYRQTAVPDHSLGGVNSVFRLIAYGSFPVAALATTWLFAGVTTLLLAPWLATSLGNLTSPNPVG